MIKHLLISDTHGQNDLLENLPEADVLIHCGDITRYGSRKDLVAACEVLAKHPAQHKLLIAGNHDTCFQKHEIESRGIVADNGIAYLQDEMRVFNGIKYWGFPWVPQFFDWAFMDDFVGLYNRWDKVPKDIDVLITHGPPRYTLDLSDGDHCGSVAHAAHMELIKPKLNVFGHIHEGYGKTWFEETQYINCSLLNANYEAVNEPVIVELPGR